MKEKLFLIFLLSFGVMNTSSYALMPLEGVVFGKVKIPYQYDPLHDLFTSTLDGEKRVYPDEKLKHLIGIYYQGEKLIESCNRSINNEYSSVKDEFRARRIFAGTLQYIALDRSVKSIGTLARINKLDEEAFSNLTDNLINNYCSKNVSVYSHKLLKQNMEYYYKKEDYSFPDIEEVFFPTNLLLRGIAANREERVLKLSIENFKAFCSWNMDVSNYRLLVPYLNNQYLMSYVINELTGKKVNIDKESNEIYLKDSKDTVQVMCKNHICRNTKREDFVANFPFMSGSIDIKTDLESIYCNHYRKLDYVYYNQNPKIKKIIASKEDFLSHFEVQNLLSTILDIPDLMIYGKDMLTYADLLKDGINQRFKNWSKEKGEIFSSEILFEEPLMVEVKPLEDFYKLNHEIFEVNLNYTLGNFDITLDRVDKLNSFFSFKFNQKYLDYINREIKISETEYGDSREKKVVEKFNLEIKKQLNSKKKYFKIPLWNDEIVPFITKEIIRQITLTKKSKTYDFTRNKEVLIRVNMNFGLFALRYLNQKFKVNIYDRQTLTKK